jgi:hypothetical protein
MVTVSSTYIVTKDQAAEIYEVDTSLPNWPDAVVAIDQDQTEDGVIDVTELGEDNTVTIDFEIKSLT